MAVRINARELHEILTLTPAHQNIMLVGKHGVGKSEILSAAFQARGLRLVSLFLGQMSDPGDLIGLLTKNLQTGTSEFLPPSWWPQDGAPVALFLDELNRARPELLQSVQDLTLNRRLAGRTLPPGSQILAAINAGDEYQLTDLDPALLSRFNIYEFLPDVDEWLLWARGRLDPRVVQFIEHHPHLLDAPPAETSEGDEAHIERTPDRRAWARVSEILRPLQDPAAPALTKALAGVVGPAAALALLQFLRGAAPLSAEDVLLRFDKVSPRLRALPLTELVPLNRQLLHHLDEQAPKLTPKRRQALVAGLERYLAQLQELGRREILADFITQVERGPYRLAPGLLAESPAITGLMTAFIKKVKL